MLYQHFVYIYYFITETGKVFIPIPRDEIVRDGKRKREREGER